MPEIDLRNNKPDEPKLLSEVPIGEWWLDEDGLPYQRAADGEAVWWDKNDNTFNIPSKDPSEIKAVRKLCDPITFLWD